MPEALPLVIVLSSQQGCGASTLEEVGTRIVSSGDHAGSVIPDATVTDIKTAIERAWQTDAHVVPYFPSIYDPLTDTLCRLRLSILPQVRARGGDILMHRVLIDLDTPKHLPWDGDTFQAFQGELAVAEAHPVSGPILGNRLFLYYTKKGARLWFELDRPLPADQGESVTRGIIEALKQGGLRPDEAEALKTWNTGFRLPNVHRKEVDPKSKQVTAEWDTATEPFFAASESPQYARRLPLDAVTRIETAVRAEPTAKVSVGCPTPEEAYDLLWIRGAPGEGTEKPTEFKKAAEAQLVGQEYADFLFKPDAPFPGPVGERHDIITRWIASAASLLVPVLGAELTAPKLYALFHLPVTARANVEGAREIPDTEIWRQVCWVWEREETSRRVQEENKAVAQREKALAEVNLQVAITRAVMSWPSKPVLPSDPSEAWAWIQKRSIIRFGRDHFVMCPNGYYARLGVDKDALAVQVERLGMKDIIQLYYTEEIKQGVYKIKMKPYPKLVQEYMTVAKKIEMRPEIEGSFLDDLGAQNPILVGLSFRRRRDLVPTFNVWVDAWLRCFPDYETLCRHIACALAVESGACAAMNIIADPGSGKKIIPIGMMECFEDPQIATGRDLCDNFNAGVAKSWLLLVNEGFPVSKLFSHMADTFRMLVTGDIMDSNEKFKPRVQVCNPMRIVFTANDDRLVMELCKGRNLDPAAREAIAIRLRSYVARDVPKKFLSANGGMKLTAGWIKGDSGQPSQFIVAKHFLWLWEKYGKNAEPLGEHGLLIEGQLDSPIMRQMQVQGGSTPIVIESIVGVFESTVLPAGAHIENGRIYVTGSVIMDYWRKHLSSGAVERLSLNEVATVLKGLIVKGASNQPRVIAGLRARWYELDVSILNEQAENAGRTCARLEAAVQAKTGSLPANGNGKNGHVTATTLTPETKV